VQRQSPFNRRRTSKEVGVVGCEDILSSVRDMYGQAFRYSEGTKFGTKNGVVFMTTVKKAFSLETYSKCDIQHPTAIGRSEKGNDPG